MMIYDDTNLYIFQPVAVNFISCYVECITWRWKIKNHITMYAAVSGNSYLHIFFMKQLSDNLKYGNLCNIHVS